MLNDYLKSNQFFSEWTVKMFVCFCVNIFFLPFCTFSIQISDFLSSDMNACQAFDLQGSNQVKIQKNDN
jgi:hypothetical protein